MAAKTLIVVHVEPTFGSAAEDLVPRILRYNEDSDFNKVIYITSCRSLGGGDPYQELLNISEEQEWVWGGEPDTEFPVDVSEHEGFIYSSGHEYSEVLEWMRHMPKSAEYTLCGGGRNECLQDIIDIWEHLELDFTVNEQLTY